MPPGFPSEQKGLFSPLLGLGGLLAESPWHHILVCDRGLPFPEAAGIW